MTPKAKLVSVAIFLSFLAAAPALAHQEGESPRQNVKRLIQVQINRSEKALSRMNEIMNQIDKARTNLALKNVDLIKTDALIAEAKAQKVKAEQSLAAAKQNQAFDASSKPREQVLAFMAAMKDVKSQLIELHKDMKAVIVEMKKVEKASKETK